MPNPTEGWNTRDAAAAAQAGQVWLAPGHTALLWVLSVIVPGKANYSIDPGHRDAAGITVSAERPLSIDERLFHRRCSGGKDVAGYARASGKGMAR